MCAWAAATSHVNRSHPRSASSLPGKTIVVWTGHGFSAGHRSRLHVVGVAGGDLRVGRDVPEDGPDPVGGAEGERVALVELGVVPVHLGQGQDVGARGLEVGAVPGGP